MMSNNKLQGAHVIRIPLHRLAIALSRLSYRYTDTILHYAQKPLTGIEPATCALQERCSTKLSYRGLVGMRQESNLLTSIAVQYSPHTQKTHNKYTTLRTVHNNSNNESTCTHQNATKPYCHMATNVISLPYGNNERRHNDGGRTSSIPQRARVEPSQAYAERERIPICSKVDARREIHRASHKVRPDYRGPSAGETGKGEIKNKASATGWPATTKKIFVVARSLRRQPRKLMRDGPSNLLLIFSIHTPPSKGKTFGYVLCKEIMGSARKRVHL